MPKTITVTDVEFTEYRVFRDAEDRVWAKVGFRMITDTGDDLRGDETVELTGPAKTRAGAMLQDLKGLVKARRAIT